jgi:hypothetical protein
VRQPKVTGCGQERISGPFRRCDRPICRDPRDVGLVQLRHRGSGHLVDLGQSDEAARATGRISGGELKSRDELRQPFAQLDVLGP